MSISQAAAVRASVPASATASRSLWAGRIVTAVVALFLTFDGVIHLATIAPVVEAFTRLGYPTSLSLPIGALELACLAIYLIPHTRVLGAVLLTGYLGGAVATQLRAGSPFFAETLFPVYFGILVWGGLVLRDPRIFRVLISRRDEPRHDATG